MLGANVLVMFLIDFLEQARVTSKQIAVERNSDLLLFRESCTLKGSWSIMEYKYTYRRISKLKLGAWCSRDNGLHIVCAAFTSQCTIQLLPTEL